MKQKIKKKEIRDSERRKDEKKDDQHAACIGHGSITCGRMRREGE